MLHVRQPQRCCELLFAFGTGIGHAASAKPIVADYEEAPKGGYAGASPGSMGREPPCLEARLLLRRVDLYEESDPSPVEFSERRS